MALPAPPCPLRARAPLLTLFPLPLNTPFGAGFPTKALTHLPLSPSLSLQAPPSSAGLPSRRVQGAPQAAPWAAAMVWGEDQSYSDSEYVALGLAQCFVKEEGNKLEGVLVIEPVPAGGLECMDNGGSTSYLHVTGTTLGVALKEDVALLPAEFGAGRFGDDFKFRTLCAARTWKRPHPQENLLSLVPIGAVRSDFNFSTEDKRVLNMEHVVSDDDNIKQDISIDVYGRAKDEDASQEAEIEKLYNV